MYDNESLSGSEHERTPEDDARMSAYGLALHVLGIPLGLTIVVGNALLLAVFRACYKKQQKAFKPKTTVILACLSLGELLAGVVLLVDIALYHAVFGPSGHYSLEGCYLWNVLKVIPLLGSFLHLTALEVERFVIVNQTPAHPHMKTLITYLCLLWLYACLCGFLALPFRALHSPTPADLVIGDILVLSPLYVTALLFVQVTICAIICTALILVVRNIVKLHQRKVQVSNTITYNNMVDDSRSAQMLYVVTLVAYLLWAPFFVAEVLRLAGMDSEELTTTTRWLYLLGQVTYTKCFWYLVGSRPLRGDFKRTFGKHDKRPSRLGASCRIREG